MDITDLPERLSYALILGESRQAVCALDERIFLVSLAADCEQIEFVVEPTQDDPHMMRTVKTCWPPRVKDITRDDMMTMLRRRSRMFAVLSFLQFGLAPELESNRMEALHCAHDFWGVDIEPLSRCYLLSGLLIREPDIDGAISLCHQENLPDLLPLLKDYKLVLPQIEPARDLIERGVMGAMPHIKQFVFEGGIVMETAFALVHNDIGGLDAAIEALSADAEFFAACPKGDILLRGFAGFLRKEIASNSLRRSPKAEIPRLN